MNNAEALDILRGAILVAVKLSAPVLILSMVIGILISILQAATQIHEQTLTFVPKLVAIVVVFQPFNVMKSSSLNGKDIIAGGSIIIPIDISVLDTTISISTKGI